MLTFRRTYISTVGKLKRQDFHISDTASIVPTIGLGCGHEVDRTNAPSLHYEQSPDEAFTKTTTKLTVSRFRRHLPIKYSSIGVAVMVERKTFL